MANEILETCCWDEPRDQCIGVQCQCGCHVKAPRVTRREWESIKIADFERLEGVLREIGDDYGHMLAGTVVTAGPDWHAPEDDEVRALCEKWGYGAVISRAAYLWQCKDPVGAFVQGPCLGTVQSTLKKIRAALKA